MFIKNVMLLILKWNENGEMNASWKSEKKKPQNASQTKHLFHSQFLCLQKKHESFLNALGWLHNTALHKQCMITSPLLYPFLS